MTSSHGDKQICNDAYVVVVVVGGGKRLRDDWWDETEMIDDMRSCVDRATHHQCQSYQAPHLLQLTCMAVETSTIYTTLQTTFP